MRIYLASSQHNCHIAATVGNALGEMGHLVVSTWHKRSSVLDANLTVLQKEELAETCVAEVASSDACIFLDSQHTSRFGLIEFGIACGTQQALYWLWVPNGQNYNICLFLPQVRIFESEASMLATFAQIKE